MQKNHFLLVKKLKNTDSAQLWTFYHKTKLDEKVISKYLNKPTTRTLAKLKVNQ